MSEHTCSCLSSQKFVCAVKELKIDFFGSLRTSLKERNSNSNGGQPDMTHQSLFCYELAAAGCVPLDHHFKTGFNGCSTSYMSSYRGFGVYLLMSGNCLSLLYLSLSLISQPWYSRHVAWALSFKIALQKMKSRLAFQNTLSDRYSDFVEDPLAVI